MKAAIKTRLEAKVVLTLDEEEARALVDITLYGYEDFVKTFTNSLGKTYIERHLDGLKSLFDSIAPIQFELDKIDKIRREFNKKEREK